MRVFYFGDLSEDPRSWGQRRTAGLCVAYLECLPPHSGASQCGAGAFVTGGREKELGLWVSLLGSYATL